MKIELSIACAGLFICISAGAQNPETLLNTWSAGSPLEKVYLHFDRDNYIAGETAWFKAYLYSDYQPDTISTSLYAELVNDSGRVLHRFIAPVLLGTANGQFELPDTLTTGSYIFRAYTVTMLNQDPDFIYRRAIFIYGKQAKQTASAIKEKTLRLEFFPEGGNLISGFSNMLAFKATNEYGLPVDIKGTVFNEKNETVTGLSTYHDGMGMFELTPSPTGKYYVLADGDVSVTKYYLPEQTMKGIALTVIPHPQGIFFELLQRKDDPAFEVAYMIGQMQHHTVFRQDFKGFKEKMQGVINTKSLNSGILQVTFFNKDDQPLAERLCFVNNKEYIQPGELVADTISFTAKGRNRISIQLKDTVQGNFSIAITDPSYDLATTREENIFSGLLLTADLKGYVHRPAYYFSGDSDSIITSLDLVMMTNGWRRFKWTELSQKAAQKVPYKDPSFITLSGKITLRDSKKIFAEKPMLLMLITADSTRKIQMVNTDQFGNYRLDSMLFFGPSRIFLSDIKGKKSQYIDIHPSSDSLTRSWYLPKPQATFKKFVVEQQAKMGVDYDAILKANGVMMQGVTVKTKRKNPVEELEDKYASGLFSGGDHRTFDLINNKDAEPYNTIFDYLKLQMPSLTVVDANTDPRDGFPVSGSSIQLYYRQSAGSVSSMGPIPMILYLDEIETDADVIATIPARQVAMVKVFSTFVGSRGNGAGGVLAIYTKKGSDMNDVMVNAADMIRYNGYTMIKEFYAPDYTVDKTIGTRADTRITLDWRPTLLVNNVNPRIPVTFHNNDRAKSYKIVVEGVTLGGKMLMIEKVISPKGF